MAIDAQTIKNLPPQHKLLIGFLFLGVVAGLFYYLVISGIDEQIAQQRSQQARAKKVLTEVKDFQGEAQKTELQEKQARLKRKIARNKELIPVKDDLHGLMATLLEDAEASGLRVVSKEQLDREFFDNYYALPVRFEVTGSYLELVKFLKLVSGVKMSLPGDNGLPEPVAFEAQNGESGKRLINIAELAVEADRKSSRIRERQGDKPFTGARVAVSRSALVAKFVANGFVSPEKKEGAAPVAHDKKKGKKK